MSDNKEKNTDQGNPTPEPLTLLEENLKYNPNINNNINNENKNVNNNIINLNKIQSLRFSDKMRMNITVIGKRKCGKSALIKSYLQKSFENDNKDTTLDIFGKKILIFGQEVSLVISEVSQDKSNFQLAKEIISASNIIFICYSLEDDKTEDFIEGCSNLIETVDKKIPIFIVGCKFDLINEEKIDKKKILIEDELTKSGKNVQEYINTIRDSLGNNFCGFYITSSLLHLNIQELFNDAIKTVAIPYVKIYKKKLEELEIENETQNMENNKKKKINNNIEPEKYVDVQVEDNGCFIF